MGFELAFQKMAAARFLMAYLPSAIIASGASGASGVRTMAIGFSGLRPGQSVRRNEMWSFSNGVLHDMSAKRLAETMAGVLSTLEMRPLMVKGL